MNQTRKRKKTLFGCIALSLIIHTGVLAIVQSSVWLYSPDPQKFAEKTPWLAAMQKEERTQFLKQAFTPSPFLQNSSAPAFTPQREQSILLFKTPSPKSFDLTIQPFSFPIPSFSSMPFLLANQEIAYTFPLPSETPLNLLSHLPQDLVIPMIDSPKAEEMPMAVFHPEEAIAMQMTQPAIDPHEQASDVPYEDFLALRSGLSEQTIKAPIPKPTPLKSLPKLPSLEELDTASYSKYFETDLVFTPRPDGKGYLFALTLIPKEDLQLPKIRQHYMFLIDRSNSIQHARLSSTKQAVYKALEELDAEDTFNILVFDSKMEKLSPTQLAPTTQSLAKAKSFINQIDLGSFFSGADLYKPLLVTVPSKIQNDEIYTAILLTDGDALTKKNNQHSLLEQWTSYNRGAVALHILGMDEDKNLSTLDVACAFNRGKLSHASTNRGLKRKILKTMKNFKTPVAKNLSCRAFSLSSDTQIEMYPKKNSQVPHLYLNQPYVIIGTTTHLDDFILFVQGRLKDRWLNIKKKISFISAKKGGASLHSEWALYEAYNLYEQYLKDQKKEHLAEAKLLLDPLKLEMALQ
jgi:hypothetical protein